VSDTNALVRALAARALESLAGRNPAARKALETLLKDPVRLVRVDAAWALRASLETNSAAGQDLAWYLKHNADMPSAMLQKGVFLMDRGDPEAALAEFRRAVSWDGGSAPLRHALAVALSLQGNTAEAVQELQAACRLSPQDPEMHFKLGLAFNEAGRPRDATQSLEKAVQVEPRFGKAWYNLGLAYSAQQKDLAALEALGKAEQLNPGAAQIPYARATILARLERRDEAVSAARRALELEPGFAEAAVLMQQLSSKE
jgi:tetratricopeptide (TPR) repeat protein